MKERGNFKFSRKGTSYILYWKRDADEPGLVVLLTLSQDVNWLTEIPLWNCVCEMTSTEYDEWRKLDTSTCPISFLDSHSISLDYYLDC